MGDLTEHFSKSELACKCGCLGLPKPLFLDFIERIRVRFGRGMTPTSGFRCQKYNAKIGGAATSSHTLGWAADIKTPDSNYRGELAYAAMVVAHEMGQFWQIEIGIKDGAKWLHLSIDPTKGRNILYTNQEA